jgi:carotenoid cleavage dioxygenase
MTTPATTTPNHPTGAYRPVTKETTILNPQILGDLPATLNGSFLRIGPNPLVAASSTRHNVLTGDAMVHGLRIRDGRAEWYRNRWVRTDRVTRALGELPTPGPRHGLSDNCNANIIRHAGRTYAVGDGGVLPTELSRDLATIARSDFDATLPTGLSAHPETDPVTGELHAVAHYHDLPYIHYLTIGVDGKVRKAEPIAMKNTSMMHAFSLTEHYAIIYDLPVTLNTHAINNGSRLPYTWNDNHGARLGILPREGSDNDILWTDIDPCYVFHPLNAYETDNHIIIDVIRHNRVFHRDPLSPTESNPVLWRYTINRTSAMVTEQQLDDHTQEFPRIDDRYKGTQHRYGFTTAVHTGHNGAFGGPALLRHDLHTAHTDTHTFGPGQETGEAVFVPRTPHAPEADGWLLTLVHNKNTNHSDLVVLDTTDFTADPIATIPLPVRLPHSFHSTWITEG